MRDFLVSFVLAFVCCGLAIEVAGCVADPPWQPLPMDQQVLMAGVEECEVMVASYLRACPAEPDRVSACRTSVRVQNGMACMDGVDVSTFHACVDCLIAAGPFCPLELSPRDICTEFCGVTTPECLPVPTF